MIGRCGPTGGVGGPGMAGVAVGESRSGGVEGGAELVELGLVAAHPVALAGDLDDGGVVQEAVEHGDGDGRVVEDLAPFGDAGGDLAAEQKRGSSVSGSTLTPLAQHCQGSD